MQEKKKQALIVDDDPDICWMLTEVLKNKNYEVKTVNLLNEAEIVLKNFQPGIIVLDNKLPDGRGKDFISFLKIHAPHSKIIFISGHEDVLDEEEHTSVADFLNKPFTLGMFRSAIEKLD